MKQQSQSFTVTSHAGRLKELKTSCYIAQAFTPAPGQGVDAGPGFQPKEFLAIWDTGASGTLITQRVVTECGLLPTGMGRLCGVNSDGTSPIYRIAIVLPNKVGITEVPVILGDLGASDANVLIGMDIITMGDFCITNKSGNTLFSFRVPSMTHVDYVKEHHDRARHSISFGHKNKPKKHK